jgi:hypothetical protein
MRLEAAGESGWACTEEIFPGRRPQRDEQNYGSSGYGLPVPHRPLEPSIAQRNYPTNALKLLSCRAERLSVPLDELKHDGDALRGAELRVVFLICPLSIIEARKNRPDWIHGPTLARSLLVESTWRGASGRAERKTQAACAAVNRGASTNAPAPRFSAACAVVNGFSVG